MLGDATVTATIAVKDSAKAQQFYGETLGLKPDGDFPGGILYESGGGRLFVYESDTAGSGRATCANWQVDNIEEVVKGLSAKGVKFEHYDMPGVTMDGDVHVMGQLKAAWFKDPDGNILGLSNNGG